MKWIKLGAGVLELEERLCYPGSRVFVEPVPDRENRFRVKFFNEETEQFAYLKISIRYGLRGAADLVIAGVYAAKKKAEANAMNGNCLMDIGIDNSYEQLREETAERDIVRAIMADTGGRWL
jgi:hypothetical protein